MWLIQAAKYSRLDTSCLSLKILVFHITLFLTEIEMFSWFTFLHIILKLLQLNLNFTGGHKHSYLILNFNQVLKHHFKNKKQVIRQKNNSIFVKNICVYVLGKDLEAIQQIIVFQESEVDCHYFFSTFLVLVLFELYHSGYTPLIIFK